MEQQNHELLGLIVASQRAICDELLAKEKKKEAHIAQQHAAFMDTCIPGVWESAKDIIVPHYDQDLEELEIPVGKCGKYVRKEDVIVGLEVWNRRSGCLCSWRCRMTKEGKLLYRGEMVYHRGSMGTYSDLTKTEFEQTFLRHMAALIPGSQLKHIEPVALAARKTKRRVVAMAE
ncbi:hypothetical protein EBZ80_18290 [bacterium]|nr:hypothetical protein [Betaproteobacteria bacterium]NDE16877.1 hypothetical protein [bacterium]